MENFQKQFWNFFDNYKKENNSVSYFFPSLQRKDPNLTAFLNGAGVCRWLTPYRRLPTYAVFNINVVMWNTVTYNINWYCIYHWLRVCGHRLKLCDAYSRQWVLPWIRPVLGATSFTSRRMEGWTEGFLPAPRGPCSPSTHSSSKGQFRFHDLFQIRRRFW
jgi:hypothetical protein